MKNQAIIEFIELTEKNIPAVIVYRSTDKFYTTYAERYVKDGDKYLLEDDERIVYSYYSFVNSDANLNQDDIGDRFL